MNKISKRGIRMSVCLIVTAVLLLSMTVGSFAAQNSKSTKQDDNSIKNVILLIPDGMSIADTTLARWYMDGKALAMDEIASGLVRTYWASGPVTDSAPAASAMATGVKTTNNFISVAPDSVTMPGLDKKTADIPRKPLATVLEAAKLMGKSTGLIATSEISHATPASFASHTPARSEEENIAEQMLYNNVDVIMGGTSYYLTSVNRKDGEDLMSMVSEKGYMELTKPEDLKTKDGSKIWANFAQMDLAFDFDRDSSKEPSLSEMTDKAIKTLSKNKNGFFLMVEGSKIDWAAHDNDPIGVISDVLAFDKAVKTALNFAKKDKHTVIVVCSDHGNGGISFGNATTNGNYSSIALQPFMDVLKKAKLTAEGTAVKIYEDRTKVKEVLAQYYGLDNLTDDELKAVNDALAADDAKKLTDYRKSAVKNVIALALSKRANIGWTTTGHTGEEVVLYCYSPNSDRLTGVVENTDIAKYISRALKLNLADANRTLYASVDELFKSKGAEITYDFTDMNNMVIVVTKGETTLSFPVNKNIMYVDDEEKNMKGLTIFTDKAYIPREAGGYLN